MTSGLINSVTYCLEVKSRVQEGKGLGLESNPLDHRQTHRGQNDDSQASEHSNWDGGQKA